MQGRRFDNANRPICGQNNAECGDCSNAILYENIKVAMLAHALFADKSKCEIAEICQTLNTLIALSRKYCL